MIERGYQKIVSNSGSLKNMNFPFRGHPYSTYASKGGEGKYFSQFPMYASIKFAYGGGEQKKGKMLCTYYMDDPLSSPFL